MTEEEAKTKWCPFARGINDNGGNRVAYGSAEDGPVEEDYTFDAAMKFPCIGSACMAWRWDLDGFDLEFDDAGPLRVRKTKLAYGHCGLAGKP